MNIRQLKTLLPTLLIMVLILAIPFLRDHTKFNESLFSMAYVKDAASQLSAPDLEGRFIGDPEKQLTAAYLKTYFKEKSLSYQVIPTKLLIPLWDKKSRMQIQDQAIFEIHQDFIPYADDYGTSIHYEGDLLYLGNSYYEVDPKIMKDKIVFVKTITLTKDQIEYIRASGAKGMLFESTGYFSSGNTASQYFDKKSYELRHKKGADFFCAEITDTVANQLKNRAQITPLSGYDNKSADLLSGVYEDRLMGKITNFKIDADLTYRTVMAENFIVTIPGKDPHQASNWITHYDGSGLGTGKGNSQGAEFYYPGAIDGGVSTALLLELARVSQLQKILPAHDMNFVFLCGLSTSNRSSEAAAAYLNNQYDHNANWVVEHIGLKDSTANVLKYNTYNDFDRMLINQLLTNSDRFPSVFTVGSEGVFQDFDRYSPFKTAENAFITLTSQQTPSSSVWIGTQKDDLTLTDFNLVDSLAQLFLGHMDLQLYGEKDYGFIKNHHILILFLLFFIIQLGSLPEKMIRKGCASPWTQKFAGFVPYKIFSKFVQNALPFLISLLVVNLILSIPSAANMKSIGGTYVTNFSLYETLRQSYGGMLVFLNSLTFSDTDSYQVVGLYLKRSLILVFWGLLIAITAGLFKGLLDAYNHKNSSSFSSLSSIILYSIPDVLVAFISMVAVVLISQNPLTASWIDPEFLRTYVMPLIALTIIPIIYIARVVFVAIEEEKQRDYVKFLRYKGFNTKQIFLHHFSRVGLVKILEVAKSVIMLIFSNLIVVEYLFNYSGIMYKLLSDREDPTLVITMALSIGLTFALLYLLSVLFLKILQPGRQR